MLSVQVGRGCGFGEGRFGAGRAGGLIKGTRLELGGQSSGRGRHDMGGGDGNLTADGLEGRTAAGAAEIFGVVRVTQSCVPAVSCPGTPSKPALELLRHSRGQPLFIGVTR